MKAETMGSPQQDFLSAKGTVQSQREFKGQGWGGVGGGLAAWNTVWKPVSLLDQR